MNYVAHIHLAHLTETSLLGNFLGDFVKGNDLAHLPPAIEQGVRLHRAVDTFTDQHALVKKLKKSFPRDIRRMSGVVIDIYFDHLLCRDWPLYNDASLARVLSSFYRSLANTKLVLPGRFAQVKKGLLSYRWLHDYTQREAAHRAFYQIEKRLDKRIVFADAAVDFVYDHEHLFQNAFGEFYPELISYCRSHNFARQ